LLEGEAGLHATWVGRISVRNHTNRSFRLFEESETTSARRFSSRWRNVAVPSWVVSRPLDLPRWGQIQQSAKHCAVDLFQRRASGSFIPVEMTTSTWPQHACEVLCIKGRCVGGSPIGAFKGLWSCAFAILVQFQVGIQ
jgi:hypothetical protein